MHIQKLPRHLLWLVPLAYLLLGVARLDACSMYKITKNGKTLVGNNEDYWSPNSQFWFETGNGHTYGVMYMGLLDNFAQGAINEAGLVFDGFFEPYLEVKETNGKLDVPIATALKHVMQTMHRVEAVKAYLETIDLGMLTQSQLVFVDRSGTYLIVEGDIMTIGEEAEKSFSNFYYSQVSSLEEVELEYFQNGLEFLSGSPGQVTLDYCSEAMSHFAQSRLGPTQYSTIYDLSTLTIRVYLFHDFTEFVELDLKSELKKGNHRTMIAELFPKSSIGYQHYAKFNNADHPTLFLEEYLGTDPITEEQFISGGMQHIIGKIGDEWLYDKRQAEGAIKVYGYGVRLMPNYAPLHVKLGKAYAENRELTLAITSYARALVLEPENEETVDLLTQAAAGRRQEVPE